MRSIFCVMAIIVVFTAACQQTDTKSPAVKDGLLKKSRNQHKAAFIMLGGGAVLMATSFIIPQGDYEGLQPDPITGISEKHKNDGIKAAFGVTGFLSMVGSIPLFIASSKNKKKAMRLSFKNETVPQLYTNTRVQKTFSALSLEIGL
jgi:hypothetical protein